MKDIAIYGFGGFGKEVACILTSINALSPTWNIIGFFDDGIPSGTENRYGKVLGDIKTLNNYPFQLSVVMAIATICFSTMLPEKNSMLVRGVIRQRWNFIKTYNPSYS